MLALALAGTIGPGFAAPGVTIRSDDFGGPFDSAIWTVVDPLGDSDIAVSDGALSLSVPAGAVHAIWNTTNSAPRVLQASPDTDFELEAKFNSRVGLPFQLQGIVVEGDDGRLLRTETHYHENGDTNLFAASIEGGLATARGLAVLAPGPATASYLRLTRVGNVWTLRHSVDGETWVAELSFVVELAVRRVGVFVGNEGTPAPAFVGEVDYFHARGEGATAPVSGDGQPAAAPPPVDASPPATAPRAAAEVAAPAVKAAPYHAIVRGTPLADVLLGTQWGEGLAAGPGDDEVRALGDDDRLFGGLGNDLLLGGDGADKLEGGPGDDRLQGGNGSDGLSGSAGADELLGGPGNDFLFGRGGPDRLDGGSGSDRLLGGSGDDLIFAVDGELDRIDCGAGSADRAVVDAIDRVVRCETVIVRK